MDLAPAVRIHTRTQVVFVFLCVVPSHPDTEEETFARLSADCATTVAKTYASTRMSSDAEIASIMSLIVAGPMLEVDKAKVLEVINSSMSTFARGADLGHSRAPTQEHNFLNCYLSEYDWTLFASQETPLPVKLAHMGTRFISIGLYHPSERTVSSAVALILGVTNDC